MSNGSRFCLKVLSETKMTAEIVNNKNVKYSSRNIVIPPTVEYNGHSYTIVSIGEKAFYNSKIEAIEIPGTIVSIKEKAFSGCNKLTKVNFSRGLVKIGEKAFSGCTKFSEVELPQGLLKIDDQAFQFCPFEKIDIPNTVTFIGSRAFFSGNKFIAQPSKIKWLSIPESVLEIGKQAFCKFINLYGSAFSSNCHVELLPSWMTENDAKRVGISEDSYNDYKNR